MIDYWGRALPAGPDTARPVAATLPRSVAIGEREQWVQPKYEVIAADLRQRIASGEFPPGSTLPGYDPLTETYKAARGTVEKAIRVLQAEGLVEIRQGAGTFVRSFAPIQRAGQRRLSQEVWGTGRSPWEIDSADRSVNVTAVHVDRGPVPAQFAEPLNIGYETEVVRRSRVYLIEDRPVMTATSYLPLDLAAGTPIEKTDSGPGGIYARLAEAGHAPVRFVEHVRSRPPSSRETTTLRLVAGTYVLHIVRTAFAASGRPVEINDMTADPAAYVLVYEFDA